MDLKYALRRLARSPGFFAAACVSLALGIGANTAAFSVVYGVLIRSMPVRDAQSLAVVGVRGTSLQYSMSYPAYTYLRDHATGIDGVIAFRAQVLNVSAGGETERVSSMLVSGNYFDVLGVPMAMGSPIQPEDDEVAGSGGRRGLVGLVSHRYWQRQLNANPAAIGSAIRVNGYPVTIAGVLPAAFHGTRIGSLPDVFLPMAFAPRVFTGPAWMTSPQNNWIRMIARGQAGASLAQTEAAMNVAFRRFNEDVVAPLVTDDAARRRIIDRRIGLEPGQSGLMEIQGNLKPTLFALMGLVGLVLLIACVNVANLMVARAERAQRQVAIAIALGATRLRFWRQSLIESAIIGASGVGLGLVIAVWMRALLLRLLPARLEFDVSMDRGVFSAAVAVGLLTTIVFALVTERRAMHIAVVGALKGDDLAARLRLRKGLIIGQLALSMLVLVAAALFTRTLDNVRGVDPGFSREQVLIASTATDGYASERANAFYAELLQSVRNLPGVSSAAFAGSEPMAVHTGWTVMTQPDPSAPPRAADTAVEFVSPDYFKTMGIPIVNGREFDDRDQPGASMPVVINEQFAKSYLPAGRNPVGMTFRGNGSVTHEVIGVAANSATNGLRRFEHMLYAPSARGVLHVRTAAPPATLVASIQGIVRRLDPAVPIFNVRTIGEHVDLAFEGERTFAALSTTFAVLALVLSSVGLFGVMASAVSRRTKELGIRLALGAEPRRLLRSVLGEAGVLVACGTLIGLPAAWLAARAARGLLFGVAPADGASIAVAVVALTVVAAVAAWIPARRASRVDPLIALRSE